MAINLDDYREARALKLAARRRVDELLRVNRDPASGVVALFCSNPPQELNPQLPDDFKGIDVRALVERARALATQI